MKRYICIHGHYYQPPRENPWTDVVDRQPSAAPFHDWNERISAECYAPNGASRILAASGRIARIVNNYSLTSFNFGPTLLSWLEHSDAWTYARLQEADRDSQKRFSGHGSALAQAYNHTILPLCNPADLQTQVIWGLADFAHRFGRPAEGMWLPEAAVNTDSLEALAAQGVKYTVLSPRSAPAQSTDGAPIVSTQPYRCALPSGKSIAIFFYNGPISQAVAFEQLLSDGARLAERLTSAAKQAPEDNALVHIATDGETYGHHHRFGDMALAFALTAIEGRDDVRLTNYGEYLERFPPTREVRIVENTSWSCEHGIERWRSHCGCSGGRHQGADQKWRTPLRAALDHLRNEMARGFQDKCGALLQDPWRARNRFILVLLGDLPKKAFLETEAKRPLSPAEEALVFSELDAQRYAMFMYTSCGWFFDDLGDIETVQILAYAARALELSAAPSELRTRFLRLLYEARSALPGHQTAQDTLRRVVSEQSVEHLLDAWESAPGDEQLMFRILEALELAPPALITERRAQALYQRSRNRGEALTALGRKLGFD